MRSGKVDGSGAAGLDCPHFPSPWGGSKGGGGCPREPCRHRAVVLLGPGLFISQTVQALDDMLQALIMDGVYPNMALLQRVLEVRGCGNQGNQSLGVPAMSGGKEGILAEHGCHSSPKPRFSDLGVCDNNPETNSCISLCH